MKKLLFTALLSLFALFCMAQQKMYICQGASYTAVDISTVGDMPFSSDGKVLTVNGVSYNVADIDSITFVEPTFTNGTKVTIVYSGTTAKVTIPTNLAKTVVCSSGTSSDVVITSTVSDAEIEYELSGTSTAGSLALSGDYKLTLDLNGVTLASTTGPAINVICGKRIALVLEDGTTNTLSDYASGSQKACLYTKGHFEIEGGGTLNVSGNAKHAISSKEYILLKKSTGAINVTSAAADGIHAGQYFQMNGGTLTIGSTTDDCIQSEATDNTTDENNGQILINGGSMNLTVATAGAKGLNTDSLCTISDGTITIKATANASKAISAHLLNISGGTFTLTASGTPVVTNYEPSYCSTLKAYAFTMSGGTITSTCTGTASRGLSVDSIATITGGTLNITTSGATGTYTSSTGSDCYSCAGIKCDGALNILGGTQTISNSGTGGKCIKCDGRLTIGETGSDAPILTVSNTGSAYGSSGGWGGSSSLSPKPKAIRCASYITINSGTINITTSQDEAEGLESKTKEVGSITINGGDIIIIAKDDAINSAGTIVFNGGRTYAQGTDNDGIDSNYGEAGAITINGGVVMGIGTNSPEEGIDADNNKYITINGGTVFSLGGQQGGGMGGSSDSPDVSQGTIFMSGLSLTSGNYLTIASSAGSNVYTVLVPSTSSSTNGNTGPGGGGGGFPGGGGSSSGSYYGFISSSSITNGTTYKLTTSTSAPTSYTSVFKGLYLGSSTTTGTSLASATISNYYGSTSN